jgi:hypothetical protein
MTIEEYKAYCMSFFNQFDKEQINKQIGEMTVPEFQDWFQKIGEQYYEYYAPVKELAKLIRGDYDPTKDYDSEQEDPLKEDEAQAFFVPYRNTHNDVAQEYFNSLSSYNQKMEDLEKFHHEREQERLLNIEVDGKQFKAIKAIPVYWTGWESDQYAWLVKDEGQLRVVASNHGSLYFTDKSFLENKIAEYKQAISETEDLLSMLK